ncbi:MAG: hypothetical protein V1912_10435 [bacterium]
MLTFSERTITVSVDTDKCLLCESKACISACQTYARGILQLKDGLPSVAHLDEEGVRRGGTECLACEYECLFRGRGALSIEVPIKGLPEYLAKRGLPQSGGLAGPHEGRP